VGSTLLPVSLVSVWVRNQLLDTDRYVRTVTPLSDDPQVIAALSARITEAVSEALDLRALAEEALPERASVLAGPIAAGADNAISRATDRLLASDQFDRLWVEANRVAHGELVVALTGRQRGAVTTADGTVAVDIGQLTATVLERVDEQFGLGLSQRIPAARLDAEFVLVDSAQLAGVQTAVRWLDRLSWVSVILTLGLIGSSVAVATDRRRATVGVGTGVAASMLVLLVAVAVGRDVYLTNLPDAVQRPEVAAIVFDTLTRFLTQAGRLLLVTGLVVTVAAWLVGTGRLASTLERMRTRRPE